tara:strand:- start:219 stop:932 length:714 start_codon:yes stop_codon:yes gene_type:complete
MKCILLAAGKGKRLLPYTKIKPKCMLDLGGTNLIEIWLKKVKKMNFEEIIINTHHLNEILEEEIHRVTNSLCMNNVSIVYEKNLLGTAGTLWSLKDRLNDNFFVINTDVFAEINLDEIKFHFLNNNSICLLAFDYRLDTTGCGIIELSKNSFIDNFIEKNHANEPGFVYSGILIFSKKIFKILPFKEFSKKNYIGLDTGYHVLPKILDATKGYKINGKVIDLRDENKLFELKKYINN